MQKILITYIQNGIIVSLIALLLLLLLPLFHKHYKTKTLYYLWLVIIIAYIIPIKSTLIESHFQNNRLQIPMTMGSSMHTNDNAYPASPNENIALGSNEFISDNVPSVSSSFNVSTLLSSLLDRLQNLLANPRTLRNLSIIWLLGIICSLTLLIYSHVRFRTLYHKWCQKADQPAVSSIIHKLQSQYQIADEIQVNYCQIISSPMLIGFTKPIILMPTAEYDDEDLKMLLAHELTHYKHRDLLYKLIINIALALNWYNPILYFIRNKIYILCEMACDEDVLIACNEPIRIQYSELMISMIKNQNHFHSILYSGFSMKKKEIKNRIALILEQTSKKRGSYMIYMLLSVVILSNSLLGVEQPVPSTKASVVQKVSSGVYASKGIPSFDELATSFSFNGGIAPNLTSPLGNLTLKKGDTISISLSSDITNWNDEPVNKPLRVQLVKDDLIIKADLSQIKRQVTLTVKENGTYSLQLQNINDELLGYSIIGGKNSQPNSTAPSPVSSSALNSTTKPVSSLISNSTAKPVPNLVSNSTTRPVPSLVSNSTTRPVPSLVSNSTTRPVPSSVPNPATRPVPSLVSNSTTNSAPTLQVSSKKDMVSRNSYSDNHLTSSDDFQIVQMDDFYNSDEDVQITRSNAFTVTDEEELVIFATMKKGTFSFDLFSPENNQVLHISSQIADQTIALAPGLWAYNYSVSGQKGVSFVIAKKKDVPIDIITKNYEIHRLDTNSTTISTR